MATKVQSGDTKRMDTATQAMIFEGCSMSQLATIFRMDTRKVKAKIYGCKPCKMRGGDPVYDLKEASRYLVEPMWPIDEYISRMNHADLPMLLRKEYWAGMRSKQLYEIAAGDLWPTERVIDHMSEVLKTIALSLRLVSDTVEREKGLTPAQRDLVIQLMDDSLNNAHRVLTEKLLQAKRSESTEEVGDDSASVDDNASSL